MGALARDAGFSKQVFPCETFDLVGYVRGNGRTLHVFLEGDGKAWLSRNRPSGDPTPGRPTAFLLASKSTASPVLYLARPCQFTEDGECRNCITPFWTSARFSEPVVHDMGQAIDQAMRLTGADRLVLIGYSGGGAVALLLAARRHDVAMVVTVAGNLDHAYWTRLHHVSPLRDSLNPVDRLPDLERVRQVHIVSREDAVMPPCVAEQFLERMADPGKAEIIILPSPGHGGPWEDVVPAILDSLNME